MELHELTALPAFTMIRVDLRGFRSSGIGGKQSKAILMGVSGRYALVKPAGHKQIEKVEPRWCSIDRAAGAEQKRIMELRKNKG